MDIKVTALWPHNDTGAVRAWVDIKLEIKPDQIIIIRDITIIDQKEGLTVKMPARAWRTNNGELRTKPQVTLRGNLRADVEAAVLEAYRVGQENKNGKQGTRS